MRGVATLGLFQFSLIYLLLVVVLGIMHKCKINQTKLMLLASLRMTVQLTLAGFILTYLFERPHPLFAILYVACMTAFAVHRALSKNKGLNVRFKLAIGLSLSVSGLAIIAFFIIVIVRESVFNPQYVIPLSGMIMGNTMTGLSLGVKTFLEQFSNRRNQLDTLLNIGATPKKILLPLVNRALETALLPTMNSMLGMGIVSLPGMMTGQILSGALPMTAILYQIAIMISISAAVCLAVFSALYFGYRTLFNERNQFVV